LLALMVQSQSANQAGSRTDVVLNAEKMEDLKQKLTDALEQSKKASEHSGFLGFLSDIFGSDIASILGALAAVAATVATGGAAGPLILVIVAVALEEGAKVAQSLGLDPKICAGIALVGAAVGIASGAGAGAASGTLASTAGSVASAAQVAQGISTVAGGALGAAAARYRANALNDQADASDAQAKTSITSLDWDAALSRLQESLRTEHRETNTVSAIAQNQSDANNALCNRI
jgi:hypothetical protein